MKNIILTFLLITTLTACSKSETAEDTTIPQKLIGSWQYKGYFSHDIYDENGPVFFPTTNGNSIITFNGDNTFNQVLNSEQYTGTFSVINGTKLTINYNPIPNGISGSGSTKIALLTENELRISCLGETPCDIDLYEKVVGD